MVSNGTKVWMTPKRLARGPEAARAELARWGQLPMQRGRVIGDVRAMRDEALRSASEGRGSATIAAAPRKLAIRPLDVAVAVGALAGGFFLGRWVGRKLRTKSTYVRGLDALGNR